MWGIRVPHPEADASIGVSAFFSSGKTAPQTPTKTLYEEALVIRQGIFPRTNPKENHPEKPVRLTR
jgi:hypothetical protein